MIDGRSQSDHYHELLTERVLKPCTKAEQAGESNGRRDDD